MGMLPITTSNVFFFIFARLDVFDVFKAIFFLKFFYIYELAKAEINIDLNCF